MKIKINKETCIDCGSCISICSDCFDFDDQDKTIVKPGKESDCPCADEAIDICPTQAIEKEE